MAKQIINLGTSPNSGTGDRLRVAFNKVNENFTEVYVNMESISPAFNKANDATLLAQSAFNYANTIISDSGIDSYARTNSNSAFVKANSSSVLAQTAFNKANTAFDEANTANVKAQAAFDKANTFNGFSQSRVQSSITINSLPSQNSSSNTIVGFKGYALYAVEVSNSAWVTIYSSESFRTQDASRTIDSDPTPGSGVIAEVITNGSSKQYFGPAVFGYSSETVPSTNIPIKVKNIGANTANLTITLTLLQLES